MAASRHPKSAGGTATVAVASVDHYLDLMRDFLADQISASDFERRYLDLFQNDKIARPEHTFRDLNDLFFDVDAFCGDPELRDGDDLDEDQLRASVRSAVERLSA